MLKNSDVQFLFSAPVVIVHRFDILDHDGSDDNEGLVIKCGDKFFAVTTLNGTPCRIYQADLENTIHQYEQVINDTEEALNYLKRNNFA